MKLKTIFLATAIVCALAACKKDEAPADVAAPAESTATAAVPADTAAPAAVPAAAPADAALAADVTGVKECDDYLAKYMACLNDKVPEASRAMMQQSVDQMRSNWKQAAAIPAGKAGLAQACAAASESAKASMKAFGCEM